MNKKILIVDDEPNIIKVIGIFLKKNNFNFDGASSLAETYKLIKENEYSLIFLDVNLPDGNSLDYLKKIKKISKNSSVIVMTAQDTMDNAIKSMKMGAYDYIDKPINLDDDLILLINRAITNYKKNIQIKKLESDLDKVKKNINQIIGNSSQIQKIFKEIGKISNSDHTILIRGESGTGKELIGKAIHENSDNSKGPYVQVNITAIPGDLLESELFGYEKGAFTGAEKKKTGRFEEANSGTILLDEIGDMSLDLQSKLLRVLEEKKFYKLGSQKPTSFNARIITSTNKNLENLIDSKKFREDLFYRLNTISIDLPPLRERKEDIELLIDHFLKKYPDSNNYNKEIELDLIELMKEYDWPGNIRELENCIKKMVIMSSNSFLSINDFKEYHPIIFSNIKKIQTNLNYDVLIKSIINDKSDKKNKYKLIINQVEKTIIESTIIKFKGNKKRICDDLDIHSKEFEEKLIELDIDKGLITTD
tara:strand:+ start:891 stop:2324 length:1434 start_codon:yes stop_codon:yes gene_type:complete